jgi:hypothetical protein
MIWFWIVYGWFAVSAFCGAVVAIARSGWPLWQAVPLAAVIGAFWPVAVAVMAVPIIVLALFSRGVLK